MPSVDRTQKKGAEAPRELTQPHPRPARRRPERHLATGNSAGDGSRKAPRPRGHPAHQNVVTNHRSPPNRELRGQLSEPHLSHEAGERLVGLPPAALDRTELSRETLNELVSNWKHDKAPTQRASQTPAVAFSGTSQTRRKGKAGPKINAQHHSIGLTPLGNPLRRVN